MKKPEKNPVLVSKTETMWQNFSLSSWSLRLGGQILVLVSKHETERKKFSIPSRNTRLRDIYSRSRLESWNKPLAGHCHASIVIKSRTVALFWGKIAVHFALFSDKFTRLARIFHDRRSHRSRQISTLLVYVMCIDLKYTKPSTSTVAAMYAPSPVLKVIQSNDGS